MISMTEQQITEAVTDTQKKLNEIATECFDKLMEQYPRMDRALMGNVIAKAAIQLGVTIACATACAIQAPGITGGFTDALKLNTKVSDLIADTLYCGVDE